MIILKSLASAFLMYSRIPMPQIEWKEENRRYSLCFFPLVGAIIGIFFIFWKYICTVFKIGVLLSGTVSTLIPIIITGGIHLDGFCDVIDAKSSFGNKEKKLEIMNDPHVGSFASMRLCTYLILQTALLCEVKNIVIIACGFVLSRSFSGIAAVTFRSAKKDGSLREFTKTAHKKITVSILFTTVILCLAIMLFQNIFVGGIAFIGAIFCFIYYKFSAYKNFGGITGDLAGWFLQLCEITVLVFTVIGEKFSEVFVS
ncbi:MAG: adenosylcobinamide-GDP ribazoletransferase [Prevotella sp.]|nr:adenosylcobinamide-GDP ribazoletransferase [Prevotella sp.]